MNAIIPHYSIDSQLERLHTLCALDAELTAVCERIAATFPMDASTMRPVELPGVPTADRPEHWRSRTAMWMETRLSAHFAAIQRDLVARFADVENGASVMAADGEPSP